MMTAPTVVPVGVDEIMEGIRFRLEDGMVDWLVSVPELLLDVDKVGLDSVFDGLKLDELKLDELKLDGFKLGLGLERIMVKIMLSVSVWDSDSTLVELASVGARLSENFNVVVESVVEVAVDSVVSDVVKLAVTSDAVGAGTKETWVIVVTAIVVDFKVSNTVDESSGIAITPPDTFWYGAVPGKLAC
jgi:hypothetical protein